MLLEAYNLNLSKNVLEKVKELESILEDAYEYMHPVVIEVTQVTPNDFMATVWNQREEVMYGTKEYEIMLFHSNDGFKSKTKDSFTLKEVDCLVNDRIGRLSFQTYIKRGFIDLRTICVGKNYYGQGYGTMLLQHLIHLAKSNEHVTRGGEFDYIEGILSPFGERSERAVRDFYLRNNADPKHLAKSDIYISLTDENSSFKV